MGKGKGKGKAKANQKAKAKEKGEGEEEGEGEDASEGEGEPEGEGEGRRLMDNPLASCPTKTELIIFSEWSIGHSEKIKKFSFCETPICRTKIIAL